MNEKITNAPYLCGYIAMSLSAIGEHLRALTLNEWLLWSGLIIGPATFFLNWYYQWRQTRAMERAAKAGLMIRKPRVFDK
ncbi:hypothetical protein C5935_09315 [Cronobacter sakazakii]|uniref:Holin n=2 Tax=Cronobacter dublinensis TaxID=413497 RepID=A0A9Q4T7I8_9ENTR|nr:MULTISPECIES: HP1 family phage holin [Cronobacter]NCH88177.1 hypothetical protein [Cronobacter dublinensis]PPY06798.1 hypothetical protein C3D82_19475 [Cronobacter sakazakii]PQY97015.1 hypothetical protein C5935_09315 [Cronobacter sakazakii]PQZ01446.1 hypothetical protein C5953_09495 [Cronobacter sakazakii]